MLLANTKIQESPIHGIGLFADQFIPKGMRVWEFKAGFDKEFTKEQILDFPDPVQKYLAKYACKYPTTATYILAADHGIFFNHSDDSNCRSVFEEGNPYSMVYAIKDIQSGEEMTDNYNSFESEDDSDNVLYEIEKKFHLQDEADPRHK